MQRIRADGEESMNEYQKRLMDKPSINTELCPFCGKPAQSRHHIVPRSQGGAKGPTVRVCGLDNVTGCHGRFHHHTLHLKWSDKLACWMFCHTKKPTKFDDAVVTGKWIPLRNTGGKQ